MTRPLILLFCNFALPWGSPLAQTAPAAAQRAQLRFVVVLTRHGVRSPTGDPARYAKYSRAAWPQWDVPPGYLTPHGFEDMKLFGAWDRSLFVREGLLPDAGCAGAEQIYFYADSDERTRESGRALAEGLFPDCPPPVHGLPQGTRDPLFHPIHPADVDSAGEPPGPILARQEDAQRLTRQYRHQIAEMDRILATCGPPSSPDHPRISLFDVPTAPPPGKPRHPSNLRGPLDAAAGLSENFLLEYTQDMPMKDVGWGCVAENTLRSLMVLHTAAFDYQHRNPAVARLEASNLLDQIRAAMQQAVTGAAVPHALDAPGDRVLFLVGHDTNLVSVAALLHLNWISDGSRDDTPPGSALVFELWRAASGRFVVRILYTAQTLAEMRNSAVLSPAHPPQRVPLRMEGCPPGSCSWKSFSEALIRAASPVLIGTFARSRNSARLALNAARPRGVGELR